MGTSIGPGLGSGLGSGIVPGFGSGIGLAIGPVIGPDFLLSFGANILLNFAPAFEAGFFLAHIHLKPHNTGLDIHSP